MFSIHKSRRTSLHRSMRRASLAALLMTCGAIASADEGANPSTITLKLLPPLPVGAGQLAPLADAKSQETDRTTPSSIRLNPYAEQQQQTTVRRVGGEATVAERGSTAKLIRTDNSSHRLRPVALPAIANENEVKPQLATTVNSIGAVASEVMETAETNPWVDVQVRPEVTTSSLLTINDADSISNDAFEMRLQDETEIPSLPATIFQVAPPTFLRAAEKVQLFDESGDKQQSPIDGDVQAEREMHADAVSIAFADLPLTAAPVEIADPISTDVLTEPSVVSEISQPIKLSIPSVPVLKDLDFAEVEAEVRIEAAQPYQPSIPSAEILIPQIYKPKSLVIDVPKSMPAVDASSSLTDGVDEIPVGDPIFHGKVHRVLNVNVAETTALTPDQPVRRVKLEDRQVCDAVLVGSHKLLLIGRKEGTVRLAVWCGESVDAELLEVQVVATKDATPGTSLDAISARLTETIAATYPRCNVRVVPDGEGLAVVGGASDAKAAREIMRLVRSACLKSVSDQIEVR